MTASAFWLFQKAFPKNRCSPIKSSPAQIKHKRRTLKSFQWELKSWRGIQNQVILVQVHALDLLVGMGLGFICNNSQQPESQKKLQRNADLVYLIGDSSSGFNSGSQHFPGWLLEGQPPAVAWASFTKPSDYSFQDEDHRCMYTYICGHLGHHNIRDTT